jgi:putative ABC transport system ATP-binding protein
MVTHDNRILELADRIVNMVDGHIVSDAVLGEALTICEFLKGVELFKNLTPSEIANVADRMRKRHYAAGEIIIRQGDVGEEFFLIARGTANVNMQKLDELGRELATLSVGQVFGEMALLADAPRNATVHALEDMDVYYLSKKDFRGALELSVSFTDQVRQIYFDRYRALQ